MKSVLAETVMSSNAELPAALPMDSQEMEESLNPTNQDVPKADVTEQVVNQTANQTANQSAMEGGLILKFQNLMKDFF